MDVSQLANIIVEKLFLETIDLKLIIRFKNTNILLYSSIVDIVLRKMDLDEVLIIIQKSDLTKDELADILCQTVISKKMIDKVNELDIAVKEYYWSNVNVYKTIDFDDCELIRIIVHELLHYNRPFSAIKLLSLSKCVNTELTILTLEKCLELCDYIEINGMNSNSLSPYDVKKLFKKLYMDDNINNTDVLKLEIAYLSFFEDDTVPECIIKDLTENPESFVYVVSKVFKSDKDIGNGVDVELSEQDEKLRCKMKKVLEVFKCIPGCNSEETSEKVFNSWIVKVRECASDLGYITAVDYSIGKLLSYAPVGEDGVFPHEIVRGFLEVCSSKLIEDEFVIGKINQRGVYYGTAGVNEKNIANGYYEDAKKIRLSHPNTSFVLDRIGKDYDNQSMLERNLELRDFWG